MRKEYTFPGTTGIWITRLLADMADCLTDA